MRLIDQLVGGLVVPQRVAAEDEDFLPFLSFELSHLFIEAKKARSDDR